MKFFLHSYGGDGKALKTFRSRRSLCRYMRKMGVSAADIADGYFLHVLCSRCSGIYDFVSFGGHLKAVLSKRIDFPVVEGVK